MWCYIMTYFLHLRVMYCVCLFVFRNIHIQMVILNKLVPIRILEVLKLSEYDQEVPQPQTHHHTKHGSVRKTQRIPIDTRHQEDS